MPKKEQRELEEKAGLVGDQDIGTFFQSVQ